MTRPRLAVALFLLGALALWSAPAPAEDAELSLAELYARPGAYQVEVSEEEWHDDGRNRDIPVKLYWPVNDAESFQPPPVVLFSHGLGGTRDAAAYLGEHWASHGYACVFIQHPGSDTPTIRENMRAGEEFMPAMRREASMSNFMLRATDIRFVIDHLEARDNDPATPAGRRTDLDRVAMSGHSFGAVTTLSVIGQKFKTPRGREFGLTEERIKSAILLSPPPPRGGNGRTSFDKVDIPCLHMTGTLDVTPLDPEGGDAKDRRHSFEEIHRADQYLITFEGGDHMVFSGRERRTGPQPKDEDFRRLVRQSSTAFLAATLRGDAEAKAWLDDPQNGFAKTLGADGVFEIKPGDE